MGQGDFRPVFGKHAREQLEHHGLVLDDEDPAALEQALGPTLRQRGLLDTFLDRRLDDRQPDGEARPPQVVARPDLDTAPVLLDDAVGDGQAQPGALADVLGREERVEDAVADRGRHARTVVLETEVDRFARHSRFEHDRSRGLQRTDRLLGVVQQVQDHLLDLVEVEAGPR